MELLKYIRRYLYHIHVRLFMGIISLIISMALSIVNPILIGKYIDMLSEDTEINQILSFVSLLAILWSIGIILSYLNSINSTHMSNQLMYNINFHLLQHAERISYAILAETDTVYLTNRIHSDSAAITSFFLSSFLDTIAKTITCIVVLGIILYIAPFVGFLIMSLLPVYVLIYTCFKNVIEKSSKEMMESRDTFFAEMQKQLRHVRTIKLNSWYERLYATLTKQFNLVYHAAIKNTKITSLYSSFTQATQIAANLIIFFICGIAVSNGSMNLGSLIIINSLFSMLFSSFAFLMNFGKSYSTARAAYGRIKELEMIAEEKNGELVPETINAIQVKDLTFQYPEDQKNIIDQISLEFVAGKIYQIKGENGCGKSTLLNLLLGLYETHGEVCYNGIPISQLNMFTVRQKMISIVEQEPPLVFGSVSENIIDGGMDQHYLTKRIHSSDLNFLSGNIDLISNRSLIDGASSLSGGEKQKVAILRALLKESNVLILDEPTSALDSQSCNQLKEILRGLKQNRIIILIDHQSVFSEIVDVIYHLQLGKVSEETIRKRKI